MTASLPDSLRVASLLEAVAPETPLPEAMRILGAIPEVREILDVLLATAQAEYPDADLDHVTVEAVYSASAGEPHAGRPLPPYWTWRDARMAMAGGHAVISVGIGGGGRRVEPSAPPPLPSLPRVPRKHRQRQMA